MRPGWTLLAMVISTTAVAAPVRVTKGPVITGLTYNEAWIAWETTSVQGRGPGCRLRWSDGLTITPAVGGKQQFTDPVCSRIHHVHLTNLEPATSYTFVLDHGYDRRLQAAGRFTTAPVGAPTSFSFVVYGDNRDAARPQPQTRGAHQAVADAILGSETDVSFLLQTGDLALNTDLGGPDRGYQEFFDVERAVLSLHPIFAVVGNHESIDLHEYDGLVNPSVFAGAPHPHYSSFDWGQAHFTLLDAFEGPRETVGKGDRTPGISKEQADWFANDLEQASKRGQLLFVVSHQSPFSHVAAGSHGHGSSPGVASVVVPLMLKYRALAIFAGHDHFYQRGHEGCVDYFVVGGGGAPMYDPDPKAPGVAVARKATSYMRINVDDSGVTAIAKATSGEVLDTFRLRPASCTEEIDARSLDGGSPQ